MAAYNPDWEKYRRTIYSILEQKYIRIEIVVADDGSTQNYFSKLEELFKNIGFTSYYLIGTAVNEGTCRNVYKGLKAAGGKYVKLLGVGDYLCRDTLLYDWFRWCEENKALNSFGKAIYYSDRGELYCHKVRNNPVNLWLYKNRSYSEIRKVSYLVMYDLICGADFLSNRELMLDYLSELIGYVKYAEDNSYRLMILDGVNFHYYPHNVCFYEYGTGISTSKAQKWRRLLRQDINETNAIMEQRYTVSRFAEKYICFLKEDRTCVSLGRKRWNKYISFGSLAVLKLLSYLFPEYGGRCSREEENFYNQITKM